MSWGLGPWGLGPWGGVGAGSLPVPTLIGVSSFPEPTAPSTGPAVVAEQGGTVCLAVGTGFIDPMTIEVLIGNSGGPYTVVAEGYIVDPEFDLEAQRVYFGAPALERGLYHLRVTHDGGSSAVLENVLSARWFAEEFKTLSARGKFSSKWATGPRILRG